MAKTTVSGVDMVKGDSVDLYHMVEKPIKGVLTPRTDCIVHVKVTDKGIVEITVSGQQLGAGVVVIQG